MSEASLSLSCTCCFQIHTITSTNHKYRASLVLSHLYYKAHILLVGQSNYHIFVRILALNSAPELFLLKTVVFTGNNQLYTSFPVASSICNIKLASTSPSCEMVQQYQPQKLRELEGTVSSQMVKWASQNNGLQMKDKIKHRHLVSSMMHSLHFPKCLNKQCSLSKDSPRQFLETFLEMTVQDKMS